MDDHGSKLKLMTCSLASVAFAHTPGSASPHVHALSTTHAPHPCISSMSGGNSGETSAIILVIDKVALLPLRTRTCKLPQLDTLTPFMHNYTRPTTATASLFRTPASA